MGESLLSGLIDIFQVVAALVLVLLNGFFVAAEFAFIRARPTRMTQLAAEGNGRAKAAHEAVKNIDAYLSVSQLGITLASLGLGWLGESAIADLLSPFLFNLGIESAAVVHSIAFVLAFIFITFLHVVFGELAPKSLAIQKAESIALGVALPMKFFYILFYPGVLILNGTANWFLRTLGFRNATEKEQTHTEEELRMIITESFKGGHIDEREQDLLQNVFRFEKKVARDVMVPRTETVFLYREKSIEDNLNYARNAGHTRYPVRGETLDDVIGLIHIKDLAFGQVKGATCIESILRNILFVPEGIAIDQLLHKFQKNRQHMAVVVDEYGGCAGIVTMENLLEELVGDIMDEFDEEDNSILEYKKKNILISGRSLLKEAQQKFDLPLDEDDEEYSTIGGYVFGKLGKPPQEGDNIVAGNYRFEVSRLKGMRIEWIKVIPLDKEITPP